VYSQSALKDFEREDVCLWKWRGRWITKEISSTPSIYMERGMYFEYLCIGGSANSNDNITDLPRLKSGEKSTDQLRIEEQALAFKDLFDENSLNYLGFEILSTQGVLNGSGVFNKERGVLDMVAKSIWDEKIHIIDLKLTANAESTFNKFSFNVDNLDDTQAVSYVDLYKNIYGVDTIFDYLVFDYSPKLNRKLVTIEVSDSGINSLNKRKQNLKDFLLNTKDFEKIPSEKECSSCPFENCDKRINNEKENKS
jgi:hypothetical protein